MFSDTQMAQTPEQPHTRIGAGWRPAPDAVEDIRERVIRTIEAQRAPLEQLKAQIRTSQVDHEGEDALDWIEQRLSYLDGLQSIASSAPLPALLSLDLKMPAVSAASTSVLTAARTEAAHQIGHAIGEHTHEGYHHATKALSERVRKTDTQNHRHFSSAMGTLERHGLDGSFRRNQSELEAEREAAEKKGEHGKARIADALLSRNTLYALDRALELEEDPAKREQLAAERQRQIDIIAEREAAMRKQLHLDGIRDAHEQGLKGQAAEDYANRYKDRRIDVYQHRNEALYRDAASPNPAGREQTEQDIEQRRTQMDSQLDRELTTLRKNRKEVAEAARAGETAVKDAANAPAQTGKQEAAEGVKAEMQSINSDVSDFSFDEKPMQRASTASPELARAASQFHEQKPDATPLKAEKVAVSASDAAAPAATPAQAKPAEAKGKG